MKKAVLVSAVVVTAALIAPLAAQAHANGDDRLRVKLEPPVSFAPPTARCPEQIANYGISVHGKIGSGKNCILGIVPADCLPNVTAQFCQSVPVRMTLRLRGSRIKGNVTIFEAWTCDATSCAVEQRWLGTVTRATRRFDDLEGGSVSGGGLFVFDAVTGELLTLDEVLVITPADEDEDDDDD